MSLLLISLSQSVLSIISQALLKSACACIPPYWSGLCDSITDIELGIPNYRLIRLDRNRHGGGVFIYAQASLVTDVLVKGPQDFEFLVVKVNKNLLSIGVFINPLAPPTNLL